MSTDVERLRTHDYTLEVVDGADAGRRLQTRARVVRIGTSPDCDLELDDSTTSRFHARIEADFFGHRLIDEDSKNGTFINDMRVRDAYLQPGARVRIGGNVLRYQPGNEQVEITLEHPRHVVTDLQPVHELHGRAPLEEQDPFDQHVGHLHRIDRAPVLGVVQPLQTPVTRHACVQEQLVDGHELVAQAEIETLDDVHFALHAVPPGDDGLVRDWSPIWSGSPT